MVESTEHGHIAVEVCFHHVLEDVAHLVVPTTAKLAQHAAQDENPFAVILPVAMGANISGVITSAIAAGIFVTTIGMV